MREFFAIDFRQVQNYALYRFYPPSNRYFLNMYLHLRKMILYMMSRKFKPNAFLTKKNISLKKSILNIRLSTYILENGWQKTK